MFMKSITGKPVHVALISGHSILIPPEGREVPPELVSDVLKSGHVAAVERAKTAQATDEAQAVDGAQDGKLERIKAAIKAALDAGDESFLTDKGIPDARKLEKLVGEPVSAAERDAAWKALQSEAGEQ